MTENPETPGGSPIPPAATPPPAGPPPYPYSYPPGPPPGQYGPYPGAYPPPPMPYSGDHYPGAPTTLRNGLGVAALVFAILALFGSCTAAIGLAFGTVAIILGFMARGRVKRGEANNRGVATAGILLGALAVVISLAFIALWMGAYREAGGSEFFDCVTNAGKDNAKVEQCTSDFQQRLEDRFGPAATGR